MAFQEHSHIRPGATIGRPAYLRRTLLGTLALIFMIALLGNGVAYDPARHSEQSINPQVPNQIEDWRGNSAHIETR